MAGQADAWWDDLRQEAELPPPPPRSRGPVILGAVIAVAASAGFGWWLSAPGESRFENPAVLQVQPEPQAVRLAGATADEEQVRRAYEEFSLVYANSGPEGLARFSESCQQSMAGDPRILDFCLAFDMFADAVRAAPDADVPGKAQARRVALVQTALPAQADPDRRIEEVQRLMRVVSGVGEAPPAFASPVQKAVQAAPAEPGDLRPVSIPSRPRPARVATAAPTRRRPAAAPVDRCRFEPTPADRILCAAPALRRQDEQMRTAYEKALAAGANPLEIDRGQAEWRAARNDAENPAQLAAFYARRIRELDAAARAAPMTPPS